MLTFFTFSITALKTLDLSVTRLAKGHVKLQTGQAAW